MGSLALPTDNHCSPQVLGVGVTIRDEFDDTFESVILPAVSTTLENSGGIPVGHGIGDSVDWLIYVMKRNVPHGKQKRGRMIGLAFSQLAPKAPEKEQNLARILGWCMEILQTGFLIADDIMDNGITRRGRPCWYRENNMGSIAFNDALMLEQVTYHLLQKYFSHSPMYTQLMDLIHTVSFQTTLGQSLDTRRSNSHNFGQFSESMYYSIAQYKTGYYTCFLPIAMAMLLAGYSRREEKYQKLWEKVEKVTLKMGTYFQVHDDYLDCFWEEKLGKKGTDIEEGKCTWLFVTAKKLCTPKQLHTLIGNYGNKDPDKVSAVKQLYKELEIQKEFQRFEKSRRSSILNAIGEIENIEVGNVLNSVLQIISGR